MAAVTKSQVRRVLADTYTAEGIEIWMTREHAEWHMTVDEMFKADRRDEVLAKAERIAAKLGVELGRGLKVNGCHRCDKYDPASRFGTYDLTLNVEAERVECGQCGATDLVRSK